MTGLMQKPWEGLGGVGVVDVDVDAAVDIHAKATKSPVGWNQLARGIGIYFL